MANIPRFGSSANNSNIKILFDKNPGIDNIGTITKTAVTGTQTITKNSNGIVLTDSGGDGGQGTDALFTIGNIIDITGYSQIKIEVSTTSIPYMAALCWGEISVPIGGMPFGANYNFQYTFNLSNFLKVRSTCTGGSNTITITRIWLVK